MNKQNHFERNSDTYIVSALVVGLIAVPIFIVKLIIAAIK